MWSFRGHDEGPQPLSCTLLCLLQMQTQPSGSEGGGLHHFMFSLTYIITNCIYYLRTPPNLTGLFPSHDPFLLCHFPLSKSCMLSAEVPASLSAAAQVKRSVQEYFNTPIYSTPTSSLSIHVWTCDSIKSMDQSVCVRACVRACVCVCVCVCVRVRAWVRVLQGGGNKALISLKLEICGWQCVSGIDLTIWRLSVCSHFTLLVIVPKKRMEISLGRLQT